MQMSLLDPDAGMVALDEAPTARLLLPANASREEWEQARRRGIGGADIAGIFGLAGKWSSPRHVYEEKHGRSTFRESEPAEIGTEIEGFIAHMFRKRAGLRVTEPPGTLVNIDRDWMRANVDRFVLDAEGRVVAPLECKNRGEYQADEWEDGAVPDAPALQTYWYMAVGGWDHGYVAALVGGNKFRWVRLERDEEIIGQLVETCGTWYQRHVVEGAPPPADGLEGTTALLAKLWDADETGIARVGVAEALRLRADYHKRKQAVKDAEEALRVVENKMRLAAAENEVVEADGVAVWTVKQNSTFAPKRFAEEEPELAAEYTRMVPAVDTDRLKADHPTIYRRYRARQLRVPAKAKGL